MSETSSTPAKKPFEQLTITDDYMFKMVMRNPARVKPLLEMVLKKKIRKIIIAETEKTQETGYSSRGIRMDVYIEDDENTVYDVDYSDFQIIPINPPSPVCRNDSSGNYRNNVFNQYPCINLPMMSSLSPEALSLSSPGRLILCDALSIASLFISVSAYAYISVVSGFSCPRKLREHRKLHSTLVKVHGARMPKHMWMDLHRHIGICLPCQRCIC